MAGENGQPNQREFCAFLAGDGNRITSQISKPYLHLDRRGDITERDNGWGPNGVYGTTRTIYDSNGWPIETISFDDSGTETSRTISISGRYDAGGTLLEWLTYDRDDNVLLHATFSGTGLTSWWMKPNSGFGIGFTIASRQGQDVSVGYSSREDGKLDRYEYRAAGRRGNVEPAEVFRYSPEGQLEEYVGFRYTRDAFGNWIEREMTVRDATTGAEVLIRRDTRAIFYY